MPLRWILAVAGLTALLHPPTALAQDPGHGRVGSRSPATGWSPSAGSIPTSSMPPPRSSPTPPSWSSGTASCAGRAATPGGSTETYQVFSVTKTFGAMLFGMTASRSRLSDEDPVTDWIPPAELGRHQPQGPSAHVLAMVSTNADLRPATRAPGATTRSGDREINRLVGVMDRAIASEPERFPGVKNAVELARKELFAPLGHEGVELGRRSDRRQPLHQRPRHGQARPALLQRGRWNGRQLIDEEFLYRMTHPAFEDVNTGYGYLTYVNAADNWSYPTSTADTHCAPYGSGRAIRTARSTSPPTPTGRAAGAAPALRHAHTFASGREARSSPSTGAWTW